MTPDQIRSTYLHVRDNDRIDPIAAGESFWSDLAQGRLPQLDTGRLMSAFSFDTDWSNWERHPAGEELVLLLSGSATLVLERDDGEHSIELRNPGDYVLVAPNTWHTARTTVAATLLFLTPGSGTEHRPILD